MQTFILISLIGIVISKSYIEFKPEVIQDESWHLWKSDHNKMYLDSGEEKVRYTIWKDNFKRIIEYNQKSSDLFLAMNHFGDMTNLEFRATMNGYFHHKNRTRTGSTFLSPNNLVLPDTVDWREKGYVSEVKNQGHCGSCWAFSTTGSLEGQLRKMHGDKVDLSEQNLVDCSQDYHNHGCHGGLMDNAFQYIKANGGIDTEKSYPYVGEERICRFRLGDIGGTDTGFVDIHQGDEQCLQNASASVGPISIAIDASHFSFQFYKTGVYFEPKCNPLGLDHGVLLVGYGTEKGKEYWLVKNSWGTKWGDEGYIKMSRNKNNQCGIASAASYPLV